MAEPNRNIPSRDEIRAAIFATREVKKEVIDFFGQKIELRQPRLSDVINIQNIAKDEGIQSAVVDALIRYAYVPGTDTKVFEDGDTASFLEMPFGQDLVNVSNALERLSKVNFNAGSASSGKTQGSS